LWNDTHIYTEFEPKLKMNLAEISSNLASVNVLLELLATANFSTHVILQGEAGTNREGYPLRPELIESVMYLYRATGDPYLLEVGKDILRSIQHSARTPCGYATVCTSSCSYCV